MMKTIVGIDPYHGRMAVLQIFSDIKKRVTKYNIKNVKEFDIGKVEFITTDIKAKLPKGLPLSCICIWLPEILQKNKEYFIKMAQKIGFERIEVVDICKLECIETILQSNFKLKSTDILWLNYSKTLYIWKNNLYIEKHFILFEETVKGLLKTTKFAPNFVIFDRENEEIFVKDLIKKIFPKCKIFEYQNRVLNLENRAQMALKYSQIMADDIILYKGDKENKLKINTDDLKEHSSTFNDKNSGIISSEKCKIKIDKNVETESKIELYSKNQNDKVFFQSINDQIYFLPKKIITQKNKEIKIVGIDLGTSRCCAAINRNDEILTIPLDNQGERLLPSYVAFNEKNVICGKLVVTRLQNYPKSTVFDSKRIIGRNINDLEIDSIWPFTIISDNKNNILIKVKGPNGNENKTAEEVSAELLKHIKKEAENSHGEKLSKVVITIPADFNEAQKEATFKAALLAEWKEIKLLPEPIAAAFAYFIDSPMPTNSTVLLFDLGGGTLNICIFKYQNFDQIQIISNIGDSKLGGRNFDTVLINHFAEILDRKYGISMASNDKKYKLMTECQEIKETLSVIEGTSLDVDIFDPSLNQEVIQINREEFQRMTQPLLNKIKNILSLALTSTGIGANEIEKVLQVGGGSRMPMIKELLIKTFPFAVQSCHKHPDEVVAIGAAHYAYGTFS